MVLRDMRVMEHRGFQQTGTKYTMSNSDRNGFRLCSACRGDYEDPDVSVARDDSGTSEDDEENSNEYDEKLPVRRERR